MAYEIKRNNKKFDEASSYSYAVIKLLQDVSETLTSGVKGVQSIYTIVEDGKTLSTVKVERKL